MPDALPTIDRLVEELIEIADLGVDEGADMFSELRDRSRASRELALRVVAAAQLLRDSGVIDAEAAFFLIGMFAEEGVAAMLDDDPELASLSKRMQEIEASHGLGEDDFWFIPEAPMDWQLVEREWKLRFDRLQASLLRECGEAEMARMLELRPVDYQDRVAMGRGQFFPEV